MSRLILIRHAISEDNIKGTLSGHIDSKLSDIGKSQVDKLNKLREKEKIDYIYTTTSIRTKETIGYIANTRGIDIVEKEGFKEINFGDFEGMNFNYIQKNYPNEFEKMIKEGNRYKYPNGESLIDSYERVVFELSDIIKKHKDDTILICSHAGTIRNIISYLIGKTYEYHWNFRIDNASVSIIDIIDGFPVIQTLNNTSYL